MVLDADTFFHVLLLLVEMFWDADRAPREGDDTDAELDQFVQSRWRLCKLRHPHDRRFKQGTPEAGLREPLFRGALLFHLLLKQRADPTVPQLDPMNPTPVFADERPDAAYGQRIVSIGLQKLYLCLTPVCRELLGMHIFQQLRLPETACDACTPTDRSLSGKRRLKWRRRLPGPSAHRPQCRHHLSSVHLYRVGVQSEPGCSSPFYLPTYHSNPFLKTSITHH